MAVNMTGEFLLPADRQIVWEKLNDPEILKRCIPRCQTLEKTSDNSFLAMLKVKFGPLSASLKCNITLEDLDPPKSYRIEGQVQGGIAGSATGGAKVVLVEQGPQATLVSYDVDGAVGGRIAQLGSSLIDGLAKRAADKFFKNFTTIVSQPANA